MNTPRADIWCCLVAATAIIAEMPMLDDSNDVVLIDG
jgi:hypothetical protein